jgi:molybdopterin converting factor small subunit
MRESIWMMQLIIMIVRRLQVDDNRIIYINGIDDDSVISFDTIIMEGCRLSIVGVVTGGVK